MNVSHLIAAYGYWAPRCGRKARLDERKLKIARYLFDRHGGKVMFSGAPDDSPRFIPLV
jgi:hypothetical protein